MNVRRYGKGVQYLWGSRVIGGAATSEVSAGGAEQAVGGAPEKPALDVFGDAVLADAVLADAVLGDAVLADAAEAGQAVVASSAWALVHSLARPPFRDRRFWCTQALVGLVLVAQFAADRAQDAHLIPVPGFLWLLFLFLPVIYAGTVFGIAASLAVAIEGACAALPDQLLVRHGAYAHWAAFGILVMVAMSALLLGDRFERSRRQQDRLIVAERSRIAAHVNGHPPSWRHLLALLSEGIALVDEQAVIRFANTPLEVLAEHERHGLLGIPLSRLVVGLDAAALGREHRDDAAPRCAARTLVLGGGDTLPVQVLVRPIMLDGGRWSLVEIRDDSARRRAEEARADAERREREQVLAAARELAQSEQRFRLTFESNMAGIVLVDASDRVLEANSAFCKLVGYSEQELIGNSSFLLTDPEDRRKGDTIHTRLLSGELAQATYTKRYRHRDGHQLWVNIQKSPARSETGEVLYFVCSVRDVTSQHELTVQLDHQAHHDPLTGLANRRLFEVELSRMLTRPEPAAGSLAVMLLDLDNFKAINDTLGHHAGDELLIAVAHRLDQASRRGDMVFRFGGDEFLYLARDVASDGDARSLAARLLASLDAPIFVGRHRIDQRASLGIAMLDSCNERAGLPERAETALRNADIALYEAKRDGKGRVVLFSCTMREQVANRFEVVQALGRARDRHELSMHYQPIVDLETGAPTGFEALMRWERPGQGPVPPDIFIPLAEHSDLILSLGEFALREAVFEAARWPAPAAGRDLLHVAVNVSPRQLFAPGFAAAVGALIATSDLAPEQLVLEVTETSLGFDLEGACRILDQLARRGVRVAIDDFGTGHSSLSRLAELRPSVLKIDRSFVSPAQPRPSADALLETMMTLARRLEMVVVAEGIETPAQRDHLVGLGCPFGQGFLFSPAVPAHALGGLIGRDTCRL